jgi:hypothetical protein
VADPREGLPGVADHAAMQDSGGGICEKAGPLRAGVMDLSSMRRALGTHLVFALDVDDAPAAVGSGRSTAHAVDATVGFHVNPDDSIPIEGFSAPSAPPEWAMTVGQDEEGYYVATVSWQAQVMCTISLVDDDLTAEEARESLTRKARLWIADYLGRGADDIH